MAPAPPHSNPAVSPDRLAKSLLFWHSSLEPSRHFGKEEQNPEQGSFDNVNVEAGICQGPNWRQIVTRSRQGLLYSKTVTHDDRQSLPG